MPDNADQSPILPRIDVRSGVSDRLDELRARLSPQGDVVSEKGRQLTQRVFGQPLTPEQVVKTICEAIRTRGAAALLEFSQKLDGHPESIDGFRVPEQQLARAHAAVPESFLRTIRRIRENVLGFQKSILHRSVVHEPRPGVRLQQRYTPLRRIGVCVPGGAAAYPSTVLMTVLPAQAAGVEQIAVVAPPTPYGAHNEHVLATCHELGVKEVYAIGGAQAVAALAYGTETIPAVDKIVGPGSLFVALAKRHVFGQVDIDSIAGPSEVVVIADQSAPAAWIAADLLAQAEHSPGSSILIAWNELIFDAVESELQKALPSLSRSDLTRDCLRSFGAMVLVRDAAQACEITDLLAPEHLHISTSNAREMSQKIRNAGATFVGNYSPVALGDYAAGPSHVLPTGATARWASGLSANSFLRSNSVIEFDQESLRDIADAIGEVADCEGLTAHRLSVDVRR